jgi:hypothetical protein
VWGREVPALSDELRIRLLGAIETNSLVFLCGAGLSVPQPSDLPGAVKVSRACYDKWLPTEVLDRALRDDIDSLAGHFHAKGDFVSVFLELVPWSELEGPPNKGHASVSDFLLSRAAHGALSANFDTMIEKWAKERKVSLQGALNGQEAVNFQAVSNPLVKFHGCMDRARRKTLWTQGQLAEPDVAATVTSCAQWITQNLPGKHLVVVGFWSDWGYLNDVLASTFAIQTAASVTVIDPCSAPDLEAKAPALWAKLNALSADFEHVQESGADFLDELREAFSVSWTKKFYNLGAGPAAAVGFAVPPSPGGLSIDELYNLRQDAEGRPYNRAATLREPVAAAGEAALTHYQLLHAGATQEGAWLRHGDRAIRVVNGAGQELEAMRDSYREPPSIAQPDYVVCAGAYDLGTPAHLISSGSTRSVVKAKPGGGAKWITRAAMNGALGI